MSRFTGTPDERWSLRTALDELIESARRAAQPGWIWVAGLLYPSLSLGGEMLQDFNLDGDFKYQRLALGTLIALVFFSRIIAGLTRLSPTAVWDRVSGDRGHPGLRDCWRAGRGLTASVVGMRLSIELLRFGVLMLMFLPAGFVWGVLDGLSAQGPAAILLALFALPALAALAVYNLLLSLLLQLALHSLVHNRRGVASALQHAWSILRHDPWAASRALAAEIVLSITTLAVLAGFGLAAVVFLPLAIPAVIAGVCLTGIVGVTRAGYWARAYRALGGLSPEDGVPGLEDGLRPASR